MLSRTPLQEIACQQVMIADASVFSVQWTTLPSTTVGVFSAEEMLYRYLHYIKKCTLTLIRPVILESSIEFRLIGTELSLISFWPPVHTDNFATVPIRGGFLVQPHRRARGEFRFGVEPEPIPGRIRISLQLSDFYPSILGGKSPSPIRFWIYRITQATLHRLVAIRFLSLLYHELSGCSAGVRVVKIAIQVGKPV